ncbi:MAG: hypothetical protein IJ055_07590 [Oscillospiraceae bacterium]|nr:hypothetical protein [Oscillospiraceae bacterium]
MKTLPLFRTYLTGFFLYALIEIAARGYTHWTMALTGGTALALLSVLFAAAPQRMPMPLRYLCGAFVITALELTVGCAVNLHLHWHVWDYSRLPLNFRGQICPLYSTFWFLLCIPARHLTEALRQHFS